MKKFLNDNLNWRSILYGLTPAVIITALGSILGAYLLDKQIVPIENMSVIVNGIWAIASFAGMLISTKRGNGNTILSAGLTGAIYLLLLIGAAALFLEGDVRNFGRCVVTLAITYTAVILIGKKNNSVKKKKFKYRR